MKRQVIIIPGIGDDHWSYHLAASLFRLAGYTPHIHVFDWASMDASSHDRKMDKLDDFINRIGDGAAGNKPVYLFGVSAGGPVAVNASIRNQSAVRRVVTLCAPLTDFGSRINPLLQAAINDEEPKLNQLSAERKRNILSIHGYADNIVPLRLSRPQGVATRRIPGFSHVIGIFLGMTVFLPLTLRFYKQR